MITKWQLAGLSALGGNPGAAADIYALFNDFRVELMAVRAERAELKAELAVAREERVTRQLRRRTKRGVLLVVVLAVSLGAIYSGNVIYDRQMLTAEKVSEIINWFSSRTEAEGRLEKELADLKIDVKKMTKSVSEPRRPIPPIGPTRWEQPARGAAENVPAK